MLFTDTENICVTLELQTIGSVNVNGHDNARGVQAVVASDHMLMPQFGVNPAVAEEFSLHRRVLILCDKSGERLGKKDIHAKPALIVPDDSCTSSFSNMNFWNDCPH